MAPHLRHSSAATAPDNDVQMSDIKNARTHALDEGYDTEPLDGNQTPTSQESTSQSGLQVVGKGIKELLDAINQLEQLGVENLEIPLPKIVVVGDQSAGKSSLVEAISEIKVPRASGTCTRCPLQINLTAADDDEWSCQVTLQKKYDYCRHLTKEEFDADQTGFYPWSLKHSPEEIPFRVLRNKSELEEVLQRAQKAILNPNKDAARFAAGRDVPMANDVTASFSPNIVRLDIKGPLLPNLSFYDLPGVINQTENVSKTAFMYTRPLMFCFRAMKNTLLNS